MSRNITIDDLYLFKQISRPRISPDGQQVAYVVTTIDKSTQKYCSSIWISSVKSGDARRFTNALQMLTVHAGHLMEGGLRL